MFFPFYVGNTSEFIHGPIFPAYVYWRMKVPKAAKLRQVRFAMDWKLTEHAGSGAFSLPDVFPPDEIVGEKEWAPFLGVSKNHGIPKSSILLGFPL